MANVNQGPVIIKTLDTTGPAVNYFGFGFDAASENASTGPRIITASVVPSAGSGIAAPTGSICLCTAAGGVGLYVKTAAGDTAWSKCDVT